MNVLEKILEEIERTRKSIIDMSDEEPELVDVEDWFDDGVDQGKLIAYEVAKEIIRSHMDDISRENNQENTRLPRDNDGWIPVEERLPEPSCDVLVQWEKYERYTDTIYTYMDKMWFDSMDENGNAIFETIGGTPNGKIIAWQPLPEPYRPEKGTEE